MDMPEIILYKDPEWIKYQHDILGKMYKDIAKECGISRDVLYHYLNKPISDIVPNPDLYKNLEWIESQHALGKSYMDISKEIGVPYDTIRYYRREQELRTNGKKYYLDLKESLYKILPPVCSVCGETNLDFLTLDHLYNNGAQERRDIKTGNVGILRQLKKLGWPENYIKENYQILCWNHNCTKNRRNYLNLLYSEQNCEQRYKTKLWKQALAFFGPCSCGQSELKFLTISHVHNDGAERKRNGEPKGGAMLLRYFKKLGWPESLKEDFCLECWNCNSGRDIKERRNK